MPPQPLRGVTGYGLQTTLLCRWSDFVRDETTVKGVGLLTMQEGIKATNIAIWLPLHFEWEVRSDVQGE